MLESNPLKPTMLVGRLGAQCNAGAAIAQVVEGKPSKRVVPGSTVCNCAGNASDSFKDFGGKSLPEHLKEMLRAR